MFMLSATPAGMSPRKPINVAIERMLQVGARPMTVLQYLLELRRDWARTGTAGKTTSIVLPYGARTALAWYMRRR